MVAAALLASAAAAVDIAASSLLMLELLRLPSVSPLTPTQVLLLLLIVQML